MTVSAPSAPLPISYANAVIACEAAHVAILAAGPAALKQSPKVYVAMLEKLKLTADLLKMIEARRAAREAREQQPGLFQSTEERP